MRYLIGLAIFVGFAFGAYVNAGSPKWTGVLLFLGLCYGVFAAAGRFEGDAA